jgi:hypothetical protein
MTKAQRDAIPVQRSRCRGVRGFEKGDTVPSVQAEVVQPSRSTRRVPRCAGTKAGNESVSANRHQTRITVSSSGIHRASGIHMSGDTNGDVAMEKLPGDGSNLGNRNGEMEGREGEVL